MPHPANIWIYFKRCLCQIQEKNYDDPDHMTLEELLDNQAYPVCKHCGAERYHSFIIDTTGEDE